MLQSRPSGQRFARGGRSRPQRAQGSSRVLVVRGRPRTVERGERPTGFGSIAAPGVYSSRMFARRGRTVRSSETTFGGEAVAVLRTRTSAAVVVSRSAGVQSKMRSEEHTYELQSLMSISYAVFYLKNKKRNNTNTETQT